MTDTILVSDFTAALSNGIPENNIIKQLQGLHNHKAFSILVPRKYLQYASAAYQEYPLPASERSNKLYSSTDTVIIATPK